MPGKAALLEENKRRTGTETLMKDNPGLKFKAKSDKLYIHISPIIVIVDAFGASLASPWVLLDDVTLPSDGGK